MCVADFTAVRRDFGFPCPFVADFQKLERVEALSIGEMLRRCVWEFAAVIGAARIGGAVLRRAVKQ